MDVWVWVGVGIGVGVRARVGVRVGWTGGLSLKTGVAEAVGSGGMLTVCVGLGVVVSVWMASAAVGSPWGLAAVAVAWTVALDEPVGTEGLEGGDVS